MVQARAGDAAVLDLLDAIRDDADLADAGQGLAQLDRASR
jgi:hypothetical protein